MTSTSEDVDLAGPSSNSLQPNIIKLSLSGPKRNSIIYFRSLSHCQEVVNMLYTKLIKLAS